MGELRGTAVAASSVLWAVAKPDRPNFSPIARVAFGVVALVVIVALTRYFGYF
jgi:hypothetical protein